MTRKISLRSEKDLDLVERFRQGDERAFDQIFETYSGTLLGFLTRMCGNREDAQESLQDTFLNIFKYLHNFRGEASLKNWIFKIAVTACLKKKRKKTTLHGDRAEEITCDDADFPASWTAVDNGTAPAKWQRNPEELYMDTEFRLAMNRGVAAMPYKYKVVINLRDFEGFSTEEVSQLLDIKTSTVKVRLHRARLQLQEYMKRYYNV